MVGSRRLKDLKRTHDRSTQKHNKTDRRPDSDPINEHTGPCQNLKRHICSACGLSVGPCTLSPTFTWKPPDSPLNDLCPSKIRDAQSNDQGRLPAHSIFPGCTFLFDSFWISSIRQAKAGRDMSSSGFAARAQSAGHRNHNAAAAAAAATPKQSGSTPKATQATGKKK
ncbi:hypothetical protein CALCODRAFT_68006 [Calocera cornea HHB12733]|uniref:Uncharacterized protein n=1 Tax=Calocera cornea HHB12733 TaxID=1353952 RepID=A0A165DJ50_9BASI|nr:hypothetical protein CALCODRAFT_68006 [Calocera cornea HHB12733]